MIATAKFELKLGIGLRKRVITELTTFCFKYDVQLTIFENKGWFSSTYNIKVEGEEVYVKCIIDCVNKLVNG